MDLLNLLATYGFDCVDTPPTTGEGMDQQWDTMIGSWGNGAGSLVDGYPGPPNSGPNGSAAHKWNGYMVATRYLPTSPTTLCVGMNWGQLTGLGSGTAPSQNQFLQLVSPEGVAFSVESELDGSLAVLLGGTGNTGSGTQLGRTGLTPTIVVGEWLGFLELVVTGISNISTAWALYLDDVLLISGNVNTLGYSAFSSFNLCNQTVGGASFNGSQFDNVYAADSRLGPCRVTTMLPAADISGLWLPTPGPTKYQMVYDSQGDPNGYPDGDASYIAPPSLNAPQWFTLQNSPCYGLNLAVVLNICFRCTSGAGSCEALVLQMSSVNNMGTLFLGGPYHTLQAIAQASFATGNNFTDAEINGSYWGVSTTGSMDLRVTQMFLEKVVSLRNVPFNCGAGSYSF